MTTPAAEKAPRRPLLIGESPSKRGSSADVALSGTIGKRLARLLGLTIGSYENAFERLNVLPEFLGKAPGTNARVWPPREAREAALRLHQSGVLDDRPLIVLLGKRVAQAFGVNREAEWFAETTTGLVDAQQDNERAVVVAPHPSGANRWWNSTRNAKKAEVWWKARAVTLGLLEMKNGKLVATDGTVRMREKVTVPGAPEELDGGIAGDLTRLPESVRASFEVLTPIERRYVVCYCSSARGNSILAARQAGVADPTGNPATFSSRASALLYNPLVRQAIASWMEAYALSAVELTYQLKDLTEVNLGPFVQRGADGVLKVRTPSDAEWEAHKHWVKEIECSAKTGRITRVVLHDALAARKELARILKLHTDQPIVALNLYLQTLPDDEIVRKLAEIAAAERGRGDPRALISPPRTLPSEDKTLSEVEDAEVVDKQDGMIDGEEEDI